MEYNTLTDEQIEHAKKRVKYSTEHVHHEHNDCIRIAYEWLDAQQHTARATKRWLALKHIIEKWGARYVSQSDVEVAAFMHPAIHGTYPNYNIRAKLTLPDEHRLDGIGEAGKHMNYRHHDIFEPYSHKESA